MRDNEGLEPFLTLPTADPIVSSFAENGIEGDLKQLFKDLFEEKLARKLFDANVLGAPHLGTFDLVRRNVNADGLVLLPNSSEEEATRYLYRAWRSRDNDGRGVHFLKTYLQMLFPNLCDVEQMMQSKKIPYPNDLYPASTHGADADKFLTSRIEITLDWSVEMTNFHHLMSVFRSVIPARLTPLFRLRLTILLLIEFLLESDLLLQKFCVMDANPCGFKISKEKKYPLGRDAEHTKLNTNDYIEGEITGQAIIGLKSYNADGYASISKLNGSWRLGALEGGYITPPANKLNSSWRIGEKIGYVPSAPLGNCKIKSDLLFNKWIEAKIYKPPHLGEKDLKLNGFWVVGERISSLAELIVKNNIDISQKIEETFVEEHRLDYPFTPARLAAFPKLGTWRKLNGWKLKPNQRPFGFRLRDRSILHETYKKIEKFSKGHVIDTKVQLPKTITLNWQNKINGSWVINGAKDRRLRVDGVWKVGEIHWQAKSNAEIKSKSIIYAPITYDAITKVDHFEIIYPSRDKIARVAKLNAWHRLNGKWTLDKVERHTPFGFLMRDISIGADTAKLLEKNTHINVTDSTIKLTSLRKLSPFQEINGTWTVGDSVSALRLNGDWNIGQQKWTIEGIVTLQSKSIIYAPQTITAVQSNHFEVGYSRNKKLARTAKLNAWTRLHDLKIGGLSNHVGFGFSMQNHTIPVETEKFLTKNSHSYINAGKLKLPLIPTLNSQDVSYLWQSGLTLNGLWKIGACNWTIDAPIALESYTIIYAPQTAESSTAEYFSTGLTRLSRAGKLNAWTKLSSLFDTQSHTPFGFKIRSDIIATETQKTLEKRVEIDLSGDYFKLNHKVIDGLWRVGAHQNWLNLNGSWSIGGRLAKVDTSTLIKSKSIVYADQKIQAETASVFEINYPHRIKLSSLPKLNLWHRLNASWKVGKSESQTPFGFILKDKSIGADSLQKIEKETDMYVFREFKKITNPKSLIPFDLLNGTWNVGESLNGLQLDSNWSVGEHLQQVDTKTTLESKAIIHASQLVEIATSDHFEIQYPDKTRLGKTVSLNSWRSLNGQWKVGESVVSKPFGFKLHCTSIPVESSSTLVAEKIIDVIDKYVTLNETAKLSGDIKLNGSWKINGSIKHTLTINGTWKVGGREQSVTSWAKINLNSALDITPQIDSTIAITGSNKFSFADAAGNLKTYQLYTTEKIEIIDSKMKLTVRPYGDAFLGIGLIYRETIGEIEITEDHDGVFISEIDGDFYAEFDMSSNLNGLFGQVTYLALN